MIYVKRKRQNKKKAADRIFFYMVFFVIIIYILGYFICFFMQKKTNTSIIEYADLDDSKIINGIIIRNEKVYRSEKSGVLSLILHNNEIAKKDSIVCVIQDKNSAKQLEDELIKINNDIISMQKKRLDISLFKNDIESANNQIKKIMDENINILNILSHENNDLAKTNNLIESIKKNVELRNQILLTENHGNIKDMDTKRNLIEQKLKDSVYNIAINKSGLVSYLIDGLENNFLVDKLDELNFEKINIKSRVSEHAQKSYVNKNDIVFKIIESNDWYIACRVKNKDIKNLKENNIKLIYVMQDNKFIPMEFCVYKIIAKNKNESLLILKNNKFVQDFVSTRNIKFKLEDNSVHGLKIPLSAITKKNLFRVPNEFIIKKDDYDIVIKADNNKIKVKVYDYDQDENYCYIELAELNKENKLNLKDIIICENKSQNKNQDNKKTFSLNQTKKIYGVYLANTGIAEFKKINFDFDFDYKTDFIILDDKLNQSIKVYDKIITEAKNIIDGQKIIER